jgi:hypothetical protein
MRWFSSAKAAVIKWVESLDELNSFKLMVAFAAIFLYMLSSVWPVLGQYILCGVLIVTATAAFSSVLLSKAGVTIKKLEPIENFFKKCNESFNGKGVESNDKRGQ